MKMDKEHLNRYLIKLGEIYDDLGGPNIDLGVCGGAGLILLELVDRTTKDIDTLFPKEWPPKFIEAIKIISQNYGLPIDWINKGPETLTSMGLPEGFIKRAKKVKFGQRITIYFASRYDQIFFKVYASADRGGYHVDDLMSLKPTDEEIYSAAKWCMTHDVSNEFKQIIKSMFKKLGYEKVSKKI